MKSFHKLAGAALLATTVLVASACGTSQASLDPGDVDGTASLTLGIYPNSSLSLPAIVAQNQGFFADAKLDVSTIAGKSGPELTAALIGGSTQVAITAPQSALPAIRDGQDLMALAPAIDLNYLIAGRPDVAENGVSGLKGKKIGVTARGSASEAFAREVLADAGVNPDDVTFIAVGPSVTNASAFAQGQTDAFVGSPSTLTAMRQQGLDFTIIADASDGSAGPIGEYGYGGFFMTSATTAANSPQTIGRFCTAMNDATAYIADPANRETVIAILAEVMNAPAADITPIYDAEHTLWSNTIDPGRWQKNAEWVLGPDAAKAPFESSVHACS
ncbi:ABC transporter substrate-binding protein [Rhodococcus gannanensis]|uniref:ABC transporter substrate-binding protein n=1 Tax=Rhodococcus gannanensis TaxID=1960308 RepID=A0ABW4NZU3_9NOCA